MLKCHVDPENNKVSIETQGSCAGLAADITILVNGIYNALMRNDPDQGKMFQAAVLSMAMPMIGKMWEKREHQEGDTEIVASVPMRKGEKDDE